MICAGTQADWGCRGHKGLEGPLGTPSGGATYTRWGKSSCPEIGDTELLYSGITGGELWSQTGGGANDLCMPQDPEYSTTLDGAQGYSIVYGTEYEQPVRSTSKMYLVLCAMCLLDQ